jgi:hypothetical protein
MDRGYSKCLGLREVCTTWLQNNGYLTTNRNLSEFNNKTVHATKCARLMIRCAYVIFALSIFDDG